MMQKSLFWRHVFALSIKEGRQILRDKSAILLGVILPLILIVSFGSGISFDIKDVKLGVVNTQMSAQSTLFATALRHNSLFVIHEFKSRQEAQAAMERFEIEAMLVLEKSAEGKAQLLIDAIDAPRASQVSAAVTGTLSATASNSGMVASGISVVPRTWFNESSDSQWYLVPGLLAIILTMTGTMLTGLVLAREWERGTMEAMLSTPVSPQALLLSKIIPYFVLGIVGWTFCMLAAVFGYEVPVRGSFLLILSASALYLLISLCIGLTISGYTRSQFLSSQVCLLASFLPTMLLSDFIFDLRCTPQWAAFVAKALPPYYYLQVLKIGFLTGQMYTIVIRDMLILTGFAILLVFTAYRQCQKRIRT